MGNPHAVVFCDDPDGLDLAELGPCFEHHDIFPERVNTEFVQVIDRNTIKMRVWERGSGETLACGTGACAAAVASVLNGYCNKGQDIRVLLAGGELTINYTDERVFMTGAAVCAIRGWILKYDEIHFHNRRSRFGARKGHYRRKPGRLLKQRSEGRRAEAGSVYQRGSGNNEPVPARRGIRD